MRTVVGLSLLVGFLFVAGCQADTLIVTVPPEPVSSPVPSGSDQEKATPDRMGPTMTKMPDRIPPTEAITPVTGEAPAELLDSIVNDLSERIGAPRERITVVHDQQIIWNDGSLGCPKPGEFYTQALVEGYWIMLELDGIKYDYRASAAGYFFLCEKGNPPASPPATPGS